MTPLPPTTQNPPTHLRHRYEVLDELPHVTGGRLFRARDLALGELVGIKQLGPGCGLPPEERRQLEETVRHLQSLPHPHLVQLYSFDAGAGVLIQEWIQGLSLLDLLRRRRQLSLNEALTLLATLPGTLDFLARGAVPAPRPLLSKLFVHFDDATAADRVGATPVEQWPAFTLKLNALSVRGLITAPTIDDTQHTVIADPRQPSDISESYGPREFARLLYELLGGRIRELDARRYSPIGALREAGNAVLRRTLFAMPHADCQTLWQDLLTAQPEFQRTAQPPAASGRSAARALHIPEPLLTAAHPGSVLRLEPIHPDAPPIHLVARPRINIGRSPQQADFLARVLPENETNNALTNRLSRVHVRLEIGADGLQARDGSGHGPSLNGSSLDGQPLVPDPPTPLAHRSLLWLGEEYAWELIRVIPTAPDSLEIANIAGWPGPSETPPAALRGALIGLPADGQPAARHAAWLFSEAGFGLDAAGQFVWDTRGRGESPAAFHYHRGCFWLRNDSLSETTLTCQDTPLARNDIAPLAPGTTVRLGPHSYTVGIE